jgi:hypothetical protein
MTPDQVISAKVQAVVAALADLDATLTIMLAGPPAQPRDRFRKPALTKQTHAFHAETVERLRVLVSTVRPLVNR